MEWRKRNKGKKTQNIPESAEEGKKKSEDATFIIVISKTAVEKESNRGISGHLHTLHRRLHHALNLGTRYYDGKEWKWKCADIETQRHVVRSIASLLDSVSAKTSHHPLIKDSLADIVGALVCVLQHKSEVILGMAANAAVKLIGTIPNSILQPHLLCLVHPLSSLLSSTQLEVRISCAVALNTIISNLSIARESDVWKILTETKTIFCILSCICESYGSTMSIEYFLETASLLSTILCRYPPSRYAVLNDAKFMGVLEVMWLKHDFSVKAVALKLYSGVALCGTGAEKLLENGEALVQMMADCMGRSNLPSVHIEGFRLAQYLAKNRQGCLKMIGFCCEPIFGAIMTGMCGWTLCSGKIATDQMSLLVEACHLAQRVCLAGKNHDYFWRKGIDRVLLYLLLETFRDGPSQHFLSLEEQISKAKEGLKNNFLLVLRPYVWDILGLLAAHCREDFNCNIHSDELHLNMLIVCACLSFVDSVKKGHQICQTDVADNIRRESASRAVLMILYSPCTYISSRARLILSEILKPTGKKHLKGLLHGLNVTSSMDNFVTPLMLQTSINLVALICYSCFPEYQSHIIKSGGIKILVAFIRWCVSNSVCIGRMNLSSHLHNMFNLRTCCWVDNEDWEGDDCLLLYGLWGLAELVKCESLRNNLDSLSSQVDYTEAQFVSMLQEICSGTYVHGPKWYAAHILSYFGLYGFPCKLGRRIGKALNESKYADVKLILSTGDSASVHGVLLGIRCSLLLPPENLPPEEKESNGSLAQSNTKECEKIQKEIRLSAHVDDQSLTKLLEFVYLGYLHAGEEHVKRLKILAKRCGLQPLLSVLGQKLPQRGALFPSFDLSPALSPSGHRFSDIILGAKAVESVCWTCSVCSLSVPHIHAHKVVLWSSCDYLRALFQSGMQESDAQTIKVPVGWEAMTKLVSWFYTDQLPKPPSGCLWDNMDDQERLYLLSPYLELCWLSELWFLEEVQDTSYKVIVSRLDSTRSLLSIDILKVAADLCLWKVVEITANYLAPFYRQLCHSGELEALDDELVDMIRAASVRLSQEEQ